MLLQELQQVLRKAGFLQIPVSGILMSQVRKAWVFQLPWVQQEELLTLPDLPSELKAE